jgi:hypothetical protein
MATLDEAEIDRRAPVRAPSDKVFPANDTLATLVPAHAHAAPEVLGYAPAPAGFTYRAVERVDVVPALLGRDFGEIRGG